MLVTALLVPVMGLLVTPGAQAAAGCAGVKVVVDNGTLGGGVRQACATGVDGKSAWDAFTAAGFKLTPVSSDPSFVCRIAGKPANADCAKLPPATAYWGLYVPKGAKAWTYATKGATSLMLHNGDTVAMAWQSGKQSRVPAIAPDARIVQHQVAARSQQPANSSSALLWVVIAVVIIALGGVALFVVRRRA